MKTSIWRVEATAAPVALRPCGTCGADAEFASTGLFRVNAQKKRLDVWLFYRCATCGSVWNSAVISREMANQSPGNEVRLQRSLDWVLAFALRALGARETPADRR